MLRIVGPGAASPAFRCDLYVNSLARVQKYHLPMVRASWDVRAKALYLAPSCAIALVTSLNIDCQMFAGHSKTPEEILAGKWLWGFNHCMRGSDAAIMAAHLALFHPDALLRAELEGRPECVQLRSYADLEARYARPSAE